MKRRILILLVFLTGSIAWFGAAQPAQTIESNQQEVEFTRKVTTTFTGKYLIYLPNGYAEKPTQNWPVLLYLHSYDARGQNLEKLKQEGLPFLLNAGKKISFIVVAPLCPPDDWWDSRWSVENTNALLDELLEKYRIDPNRIYLTGWSMGGAGVWRLASQHPTRFAAIAPISGRTQLKYAPVLRNTPIWAFHGAKDTVVPLSESQKMVESLQKSGGEAKLTVFPDTGHDAWQQVYGDSKFYEWLLQHSAKEGTK